MKYLLLDTYNLFYRALHASYRGAGSEEKADFAIHVILQSLGATWRDQKADHIVVMLEGRSWRKDVYPPYKADRVLKAAAATEKEKEEKALFDDALTKLIAFLDEKTNVTVLQNSILEADDLIAGWIRHHPNDEHVIISSDSDFHQLLNEKVTQYNGVTAELYTIHGIYDKKMNLKVDKKTKQPITINPPLILFEKCVRGDATDNVFSAYPGARLKGTKNKVGILEAYADKDTKGYNWNNFMLQRFMHHDGTEHRVLDDYNRNVMLVDLNAQPDDVKAVIDQTITEACVPKNKPMIGVAFMKLCAIFGLEKISNQATFFSNMLCAAYPKGE